MILGFAYVTNAINCLRLEKLVCWTSVNEKQVLKPHPFGKPALAQKVTSKISTFIIKSYLEKDLKSITTNVAMYLTPVKKEKYPTPPIYRNKQWVYCLKTIESEKFQKKPYPLPPTSLLYGCYKWMAPEQFLTLKG